MQQYHNAEAVYLRLQSPFPEILNKLRKIILYQVLHKKLIPLYRSNMTTPAYVSMSHDCPN